MSQADLITLWHYRWGKIIPHYMPPLLVGKGTAHTERARESERERASERASERARERASEREREIDYYERCLEMRNPLLHSNCRNKMRTIPRACKVRHSSTQSYDNTEHNIVQERSVTSCKHHHRASLQSSPQALTNGTTTTASTNAKRGPREVLVQVALTEETRLRQPTVMPK